MKYTLALILTLFASTAFSSETPLLINGAGATFPYPLYAKWFSEYQKKDLTVQFNYQSIGSGGGIRQFSEKTVDFGATDSPMTDEQLTKAGAPVLHIPTALGAVVMIYNLEGLKAALKLTPELVANIYLGKVTQWDDAEIKKVNPGVTLPSLAILVTRRSDGSGTSGIFTDYLSKVSAEWKTKVGSGTSVNWPAGLGGKGNEGVTGLVKQTPGAIGYVEMIYAANNKLPFASIKNRAGQFVVASSQSVSAAAAGAMKTLPADFRVSITDAEGKASYPISGFTYLLVWKNMPKDKGSKLVSFMNWAIDQGQAMTEELHYAPLPKVMIKKVKDAIHGIQTN